jgi:cell pole-organizing protein PopZ
MSEARSANNDPSMDDILASIRKIISDDQARAQVGRQQAPNQSTRSTVISSAETQPDAVGRDDVLLLTDLIEEPGSSPVDAKPAPVPLPRIDPAQAAEMPQPSVEPPPGDTRASDTQAGDVLVGEALVGAGVVGAASSAFARLNQAVQESVPQPAAHEPGPSIDGNGKTIEDLVREMLRPMLKEWLDRNLPPMVERFVEREIVRLTRR